MGPYRFGSDGNPKTLSILFWSYLNLSILICSMYGIFTYSTFPLTHNINDPLHASKEHLLLSIQSDGSSCEFVSHRLRRQCLLCITRHASNHSICGATDQRLTRNMCEAGNCGIGQVFWQCWPSTYHERLTICNSSATDTVSCAGFQNSTLKGKAQRRRSGAAHQKLRAHKVATNP